MKRNNDYDYPKYYTRNSMYFSPNESFQYSDRQFDPNKYVEQSRKFPEYFCVSNAPDILFDFPYKSSNPLSYGMEYKVRRCFMGRQPKDPSKKPPLLFKVQFSDDLVFTSVPYKHVKAHDIINPYFRCYWGTCAIGNIKFTRTTTNVFDSEMDQYINHVFDVWIVIMSRCFNPNDDCYHMFGAKGLMPLYYSWTIFEEFFKYVDYARRIPGLIPIEDPNDPALYCQYSYLFTNFDKVVIRQAPHPNGLYYHKVPTRIVCGYSPYNRTKTLLNPNYSKPGNPEEKDRSMCTVVRK